MTPSDIAKLSASQIGRALVDMFAVARTYGLESFASPYAKAERALISAITESGWRPIAEFDLPDHQLCDLWFPSTKTSVARREVNCWRREREWYADGVRGSCRDKATHFRLIEAPTSGEE